MENLTESYDVLKLQKVLDKIRNNKLNDDILEELLNILIPKKDDKLLTDYKLGSRKNVPAIFMPQYNSIFLDVDEINKWILNNMDMVDCFGVEIDDKELKAYLGIFSTIHEINHAIQYHISKGNISGYPKELTIIYDDILKIFKDNSSIIPGNELYRFIKLIRYKLKENELLLERNANIETFRLLQRISEYEKNEKATLLFRKAYELMIRSGYNDKYNGALEETYRRLWMGRKFKKIEFDIYSEEDNMRYGFPLVKKK